MVNTATYMTFLRNDDELPQQLPSNSFKFTPTLFDNNIQVFFPQQAAGNLFCFLVCKCLKHLLQHTGLIAIKL